MLPRYPPPEMMAEGHTVGLRTILEFNNWCLLPSLNTLVDPTPMGPNLTDKRGASISYKPVCWTIHLPIKSRALGDRVSSIDSYSSGNPVSAV